MTRSAVLLALALAGVQAQAPRPFQTRQAGVTWTVILDNDTLTVKRAH